MFSLLVHLSSLVYQGRLAGRSHQSNSTCSVISKVPAQAVKRRLSRRDHRRVEILRFLTLTASICMIGTTVRPQTAPGRSQQNPLKNLSLEELGNIEVTTVSKEPEEVWNTPAAIYVITQEDIQRSGATNIPEALRLAPGVEVARITSGEYAIGIRGFNSRLSRSVLVLIDGRTVYSTFTAGTYWETQDVLMKDIDRIEVIRGPGGTIWGPNAVNGVINIITKNTKDTPGRCSGREAAAMSNSSSETSGTVLAMAGDSRTGSMQKDLDGRHSTTPMAIITTIGIAVRVASGWTGIRMFAIATGCRAMYTANTLARE